jgi:post-segregation antitoxin (ccd killing protein)
MRRFRLESPVMGKTELKLEIDADMLARAEAASIPLERALEIGLRMALEDAPRPLGLVEAARRKAADPQGAEECAAAWRRDKAEAIASYNRYVEENGAFGEDLSRW